MRFARSVMLIAGIGFAGQAIAAVPVRPAAAAITLQPTFIAGARVGDSVGNGKSRLGGGSAIIPLVLLAGIAAGGVVVATKDHNHGSVSP